MWDCSNCQESIEDSFERCWNCGADQDGVLDPEFVHADDYLPEEPARPPREFDPALAAVVIVFSISMGVFLLVSAFFKPPPRPFGIVFFFAHAIIYSIWWFKNSKKSDSTSGPQH